MTKPLLKASIIFSKNVMLHHNHTDMVVKLFHKTKNIWTNGFLTGDNNKPQALVSEHNINSKQTSNAKQITTGVKLLAGNDS